MPDANIEYVPHKAIDKTAWNACVDQASNGLIYARTEYLDAMADNWDALIYGDYEAVMPLTWRSKFGIKYLYQPAFTQQLGVFFKASFDKKNLKDFIPAIPKDFKLIEIYLNYDNFFDNALACKNYILLLNQGYSSIASNYTDDLKRNLNKAAKKNLHYKTTPLIKLAITSFKEHYKERMKLQHKDYENFTGLCEAFLIQQKAFTRTVFDSEDNLLAIGLFIKDQKRIYNLACTTLQAGRKLSANHLLINNVVQELSGQNLILDFEGSDIPGIASFYKNFSGTNQPYFYLRQNKLPAVLRLLKK